MEVIEEVAEQVPVAAAAGPAGPVKVKRKSYSLAEKLKIIRLSEASALTQRQFAASVNINESMLRRWVRDKAKIGKTVQHARRIRRIPRPRIGMFPELDQKVYNWVRDRNARGIRVKDRFIRHQALVTRDVLTENMPDGDQKAALQDFEASNMWIHRFKRRFNLKSRRHTTVHTMPEDFREQAIGFVENIHKLIDEFAITREHILNLDQVPR